MKTVQILRPDGTRWREVRPPAAMILARSWNATIQLSSSFRLSPYPYRDRWECISKQKGVIVTETLTSTAVWALLEADNGTILRCPENKFLRSVIMQRRAAMSR